MMKSGGGDGDEDEDVNDGNRQAAQQQQQHPSSPPVVTLEGPDCCDTSQEEGGGEKSTAAASVSSSFSTTNDDGLIEGAAPPRQVNKEMGCVDDDGCRWWGGLYAAVLPASPNITVTQLWDACLQQVAASDDNDDTTRQVEWRSRRTCELLHPQLSKPLPYLEVSGLVTRQEAGQIVVDALISQHPDIVGNAELLLMLEGTEIPLLSMELPVDGSIDSLLRCGVVAIPTAVESRSGGAEGGPNDLELLLDDVLAYSLRRLDVLRERLAVIGGGGGGRQGTNPHHQHRFREIMQRDPNRYDFRLDLPATVPGQQQVQVQEDAAGASVDDDQLLAVPCWERLERQGSWLSLVQQVLGNHYRRVKCGCVVSLPGAQHQYWHSDGVHVGPALSLPLVDDDDKDDATERVHPPHALCVFVPLITLTHDTGTTEFWAGSHKYNKLLSQKGEASLPGGTLGFVPGGGAVVYDYRVVHRGTANVSDQPRPILYFLYVKPGYESVEDQNFTSRSIWDES